MRTVVIVVAKRGMLVAVNRELRTMPDAVQATATAALAQWLAREVDAGDRPAAGPLMRALNDLRRLSAPPEAAAVVEEVMADELDDLARARAARLADASGVVSSFGGHERRSGGRAAR